MAPTIPLTMTKMNSTISVRVSGAAPRLNPEWKRMNGKLSSPSQRCPRIQLVARPTRHTGNFFLAPRSPANSISAEPMLP